MSSNYNTSAASSTSVTFTFTDNTANSYTFTVTATAGANSLTSATSAAVNTPSLVPTPDLVWLKFDSTTYTGVQSLVNAGSAGTVSANFWSANGTITNTTKGGSTCAYITNNNSGSNGKWTVTTSSITLPANVAGNGWTLTWWMYISSGGLAAGNGAQCMLATFNSPNTATQGWINSYYSGSYFNGSGDTTSSFVYWYPTSAYNDSASWATSPTGVWHHIAFVVTCTSVGSATFAPYHNGSLENGGSTLGTNYPNTGTSVNFAINANSANIYYHDVRLYGTPLTSTQINTMYTAGL